MSRDSVILWILALSVAAGCARLEVASLYRSGTRALDAGDTQRAVADLERAAALAPEVSATQNHLGLAYLEVGRRDAARAAFQRAVDLDCDNHAARRNLELLEASMLSHATQPAPAVDPAPPGAR